MIQGAGVGVTREVGPDFPARPPVRRKISPRRRGGGGVFLDPLFADPWVVDPLFVDTRFVEPPLDSGSCFCFEVSMRSGERPLKWARVSC